MFKKFAEKILTKGIKKVKPKVIKKPVKPKATKPKTPPGIKIKSTRDLTKTEKAALAVAGGGTGALTALKLKQRKEAQANRPKAMDSVTGNPATKPKKKPLGKKGPQSGPKKKKKLADLSDKFVKTKKGFLKDKTGKRVKRLSKEELAKKRKNR